MEIAVFNAIHTLYTKSLRRSNALFEHERNESGENQKMDLIKRIDAILDGRGWGWADLARKMKLSEQRVNNWRTRGIPAAQVRNIETALGLQRYALDSDNVSDDEAAVAISEFSWVYRNANEKGRETLRNAVVLVRQLYVEAERRSTSMAVVRDRRKP